MTDNGASSGVVEVDPDVRTRALRRALDRATAVASSGLDDGEQCVTLAGEVRALLGEIERLRAGDEERATHAATLTGEEFGEALDAVRAERDALRERLYALERHWSRRHDDLCELLGATDRNGDPASDEPWDGLLDRIRDEQGACEHNHERAEQLAVSLSEEAVAHRVTRMEVEEPAQGECDEEYERAISVWHSAHWDVMSGEFAEPLATARGRTNSILAAIDTRVRLSEKRR